MSRILIATIPVLGHVTPLIAIAEQLIAQGHDVEWYTGKFFSEIVERVAKFHPIQSSPDYASFDEVPPAIVAERDALNGIRQIKYDLKNFFVSPSIGYYSDLSNILNKFQADVILSDSFFIAASWISETYNIPWVQVCVSVLAFDSEDVAPFGLGLQPSSSFLGKLRNKLLNRIIHNFIYKEVLDFTNSERVKIGLNASTKSFQNVISSNLFISGSVKEFEYPRSDLPSQVHFVSPLQASILKDYDLPEWWDELYNNKKPVIVVTQGTVATNLEDLVIPTIHAMHDQEVFLIVTTGGKNPIDLHLGKLSQNVKIEKFIPYHLLFPFVDLFISNAGFNGVMMALSYGVPIIAAGKTEDKAEVSGRIQYSGVGINLKTSKPSAKQVKSAVAQILESQLYKSKAMKIKSIIAKKDSAKEAVNLIETLLSNDHP